MHWLKILVWGPHLGHYTCADPDNYVCVFVGGGGGGQTFLNLIIFKLFSLMRGERIQIPLRAGHHRPASETPFKCCLGSFVIFQGIRTSIAEEPYIFVIFQGVSVHPDPHLWIRACYIAVHECSKDNFTRTNLVSFFM